MEIIEQEIKTYNSLLKSIKDKNEINENRIEEVDKDLMIFRIRALKNDNNDNERLNERNKDIDIHECGKGDDWKDYIIKIYIIQNIV